MTCTGLVLPRALHPSEVIFLSWYALEHSAPQLTTSTPLRNGYLLQGQHQAPSATRSAAVGIRVPIKICCFLLKSLLPPPLPLAELPVADGGPEVFEDASLEVIEVAKVVGAIGVVGPGLLPSSWPFAFML